MSRPWYVKDLLLYNRQKIEAKCFGYFQCCQIPQFRKF